MASLWGIKIAEALLSHYALLIMLWNEFDIAEIETLWLSRVEIWGTRFTSTVIFSVFSVIASWIDFRDAFHKRLFMLFFAYIAV